jgi:hypothetical protein
MQLDYAIEGYWLAKRCDFNTNTITDYTFTFKCLTEFVGKNARAQGHFERGHQPLPQRPAR